MTCYMRHMAWLFEALGLAYDAENRRRVDSALREVLAVGPDAHCPEIWAAVKTLDDADREALVPAVGSRLT
jgi:hypothetical protein